MFVVLFQFGMDQGPPPCLVVRITLQFFLRFELLLVFVVLVWGGPPPVGLNCIAMHPTLITIDRSLILHQLLSSCLFAFSNRIFCVQLFRILTNELFQLIL